MVDRSLLARMLGALDAAEVGEVVIAGQVREAARDEVLPHVVRAHGA